MPKKQFVVWLSVCVFYNRNVKRNKYNKTTQIVNVRCQLKQTKKNHTNGGGESERDK